MSGQWVDELAEDFGTPEVIDHFSWKRARAKRAAPAPRPRPPPKADLVAAIREAAKTGETQSSIAKRFGTSQPKVSAAALAAGLRGTGIRSGENHPLAKLNDADIVEIRRQHAAGVSLDDLASKYRLKRVAIYVAVRRGRSTGRP